MVNEKEYTQELNKLLDYIYNNIIKEFPDDNITPYHFVMGILDEDICDISSYFSNKLMQSQIDKIREKCIAHLVSNKKNITTDCNITDTIANSDILKNISIKNKKVGSVDIFLSLLEKNETLKIFFRSIHVTSKNILKYFIDKTEEIVNKPKTKNEKPIESNEVEKQLTNLNHLASIGKISETISNEKIYKNIFRTLLRKENNNVLLVGDSGVGKTVTIKNIANKILSKNLPKALTNKILMEVDFSSLLSGMMFKGAYETRIKTIINDAKRNNKYIFFIDDIDILLDNSKYSEVDVETFINAILNENKIGFIATLSNKGYSKLSNKSNIINKCTKISIDEPSEEECIDILNRAKLKYEKYHNIKFTEEAILDCIKLSKRYINDCNLPNSAINILDEVGAELNINETEDKEIVNLKKQLVTIQTEKENAVNSNNKDYNKIDELSKKEIELVSLISLAEKNMNLNKEKLVVNTQDIANIISEKTGIPLTEINHTEKQNLKNIDSILKEIVIGQDDAIDEVCRIIKRQRVGLSNPNKPAVMMFTGSTGTGKTFLAKKIAEKIFGNEKYLVRLDMSEYSDKMAAAKLVGSSQGYIGYDDGAMLTEAIKKNKYCVLLLDECEKADDTAFNIFLQIFDDGRLTDNKGNVVDFKNTIIIMTSNIGAQEVSERNGGIGFSKNNDSKNNFEKGIFEKAIKKRFKPEFINRIDKIIYFNKLNEENLKKIIVNEIKNINSKLENIGYSLYHNVYNKMTDIIYEKIKDKIEYGARPIIRAIDETITDKITDLLIDNVYEKGHKFTFKEISVINL